MQTEFSDTIKMNNHWANYLTKTPYYKWNWAEGAYRSSKSYTNTLAFCMALEKSRDILHLVIASTTTSAMMIVEEYLKVYFGSRYTPNKKYKGCNAGYLNINGSRKIIVYVGGSMANSYTAFRGWSVGCIVLEEMNLLHENTINEARGRNLMAKDPQFFVSHNPVSPKHAMYKMLNELIEKGIVNYDHSTIFDNPALTQERIDEIVAEFDPDTPFYRQFILGERIDAGSLVYNIKDYNLIDTINPDDYLEYVVVCDEGMSKSSSAFVCAALRYDNKKLQYCLDIIKEYKYLNNAHNIQDQKMYKDTATDLAIFTKECIDYLGKYPTAILIDIDPEFWRNCQVEFRHNQLNPGLLKYVSKIEIADRIKYGNTLLFRGKLRFNSACKETIADFKYAIYDPDKITKKGEFVRLQEFNEEGHLDMINAVEYGFIWYANKLYMN